jgi:hypothetical protein
MFCARQLTSNASARARRSRPPHPPSLSSQAHWVGAKQERRSAASYRQTQSLAGIQALSPAETSRPAGLKPRALSQRSGCRVLKSGHSAPRRPTQVLKSSQALNPAQRLLRPEPIRRDTAGPDWTRSTASLSRRDPENLSDLRSRIPALPSSQDRERITIERTIGQAEPIGFRRSRPVASCSRTWSPEPCAAVRTRYGHRVHRHRPSLSVSEQQVERAQIRLDLHSFSALMACWPICTEKTIWCGNISQRQSVAEARPRHLIA